MRMIDASNLWSEIQMLPHNGDMISSEEVEQAIANAPTIDTVPVVWINQVKEGLLFRMDEFTAEYRRISENSIDHFGGKADAMEVARRLVNAVLTDLCADGERKEGTDNG